MAQLRGLGGEVVIGLDVVGSFARFLEAMLLAEGFEQYPDLYRPLTTERNRRWLDQVEELLDDREDYLVIVGTLHLVGKDSLIDLLENRGHKVSQH